MEPAITKNMLQANEIKARLTEDHSNTNIASTDNGVDFNDVVLGDKLVNDANDSNMQHESLLIEIDNHGEQFLLCGKSSLALDEHACESDCVSSYDMDVADDAAESNDSY